MLRNFCATVVAVVSCVAISSTAEAQVRQPSGYFVMQGVGFQNIKDDKLMSPVFTGIVIRERWANITPTSATYSWTFLDQQTARARKYRKRYILSIYTGYQAPKWLKVPLYKGAPYPWDPTMLSAHARMVAALGARYGNDPYLAAVEISGPTRDSLEMHMAQGLKWQPGYSPARMIAAWSLCADQYARAFPNCGLISDGGVAPGGFDATITLGFWNYLATSYPHQANFSHCALKASTNPLALHHRLVVSMAQQGHRVGFEMTGPSVGGVNGENGPLAVFGGTFDEALVVAAPASPQWLKIYQADELNAMNAGF